MDCAILTNWTSPFVILGLSWAFFKILFRIQIPVSKHCRGWSDVAFCGVWSGSALFVYRCPKMGHGTLGKYGLNEPPHDKINKVACAPNEDSDQPGYPPSLIRVFAVRLKKAWVLSYPLSAQRRLWSHWADAQADLSLRWVHTHFVGFVMSRLKYV